MCRIIASMVVLLIALPNQVQAFDKEPDPAVKSSADKPSAERKPRPERGSRELLRYLLNETVDTRHFQGQMTFKEAIDLLAGYMASVPDPPVYVNEEAFRLESPDDPKVLETPIRLPPMPRKTSTANVLRIILTQAPRHNATFIMRAGLLEITTLKAASPKQLLRQKVVANFKDMPLDEALEELAEHTGLSVIVDVRVGDKIKTPVSASLGNDAGLEGVLRFLTDMAGLELVVSDDAVYVTTPANAQRLRHTAR